MLSLGEQTEPEKEEGDLESSSSSTDRAKDLKGEERQMWQTTSGTRDGKGIIITLPTVLGLYCILVRS